ncbi:MAG TPA: tripartite tricarboxylate transporter TctB family protein [Usitatibacter sp.]|nr:tripartite tricarboxylate transporter TctB family protein [Usitatibacter sp.]
MVEKPAAGADLVIPALALAFAAYFFTSISGLAWEAKANGMIIGTVLCVLSVVQVARILLAISRGRATLSTRTLWEPREVLGKRLGMVALTIAFIATIPWLGLTLGLFTGMAVSLWLMGVRRWGLTLLIAFVVAAAAYGLFIAALDANFPHGPVENAIDALRGKAAK